VNGKLVVVTYPGLGSASSVTSILLSKNWGRLDSTLFLSSGHSVIAIETILIISILGSFVIKKSFSDLYFKKGKV
jgi:hypothetical protein